jgi:hypothetical protein
MKEMRSLVACISIVILIELLGAALVLMDSTEKEASAAVQTGTAMAGITYITSDATAREMETVRSGTTASDIQDTYESDLDTDIAIDMQDVPLSDEERELFLAYCEKYDCPVELALAVAEIESGFDWDKVGAAGEIGIMQIYGGEGGKFFEEHIEQTGMDPETREGNIACGCYLLGKYLEEFGNKEMALMAYNFGRTGAKELWSQGIYTSGYASKAMEACERWKARIYNLEE